jgi:signal transduction histidine kinase
MTVFLRIKKYRGTIEDGLVFLGVIFLSIVTHLFNGFSELGMTIAKLPIFYKQRDLLFYPSWAYALPTWLLKIPILVLECAIWVGMTYYVIGFDPNIGRFFRHYLLVVLISQMASGLFRLLAALGREMVIANTFGSFADLVMLILGGFLISYGMLVSA